MALELGPGLTGIFESSVCVLPCSVLTGVEEDVLRPCEDEADGTCGSFTGRDIASSFARALKTRKSQIADVYGIMRQVWIQTSFDM